MRAQALRSSGGTKEPWSILGERQGRDTGGGKRSVTAPATCRPGLSFAPKSRLSRTRGQAPALEPVTAAATSPGHPSGMGGGRRQEVSDPFISRFRSEEMKNKKFQM